MPPLGPSHTKLTSLMAAPSETQTFSLLFIVDLIKKYLLYIVAVVVLSCIAAIVLTMPAFYPPEYNSSLVVFTHAPERYDMDNIFERQPGMYTYGDSKEAEKMINIAESEELQLAVIDSLDLWSAYGIDKENDAHPKFYVLENYRGNVSVKRVSGNGIQIDAYATDPQLAADIVNTVVYLLNQFNRQMMHGSKGPLVQVLSQGEAELEARINELSDSVRTIRKKYHILRSLTQSEVMAEQVLIAQGELAEAEARSGANSAPARAKRRKLEALTESGPTMNLASFQEGLDLVMTLEEQIQTMSQELGFLRRRAQYIQTLSASEYNTIVVPSKALPADKKARPVRWVIMVAAFLVSFLVSVIAIVLIDRLTRDKEDEPEEGASPSKAMSRFSLPAFRKS